MLCEAQLDTALNKVKWALLQQKWVLTDKDRTSNEHSRAEHGIVDVIVKSWAQGFIENSFLLGLHQ